MTKFNDAPEVNMLVFFAAIMTVAFACIYLFSRNEERKWREHEARVAAFCKKRPKAPECMPACTYRACPAPSRAQLFQGRSHSECVCVAGEILDGGLRHDAAP